MSKEKEPELEAKMLKRSTRLEGKMEKCKGAECKKQKPKMT